MKRMLAWMLLVVLVLSGCQFKKEEKPMTNPEPVKADAAVFILLGQSNAVGHALPMAANERIDTPMKNVYGLHRDPNQSYSIKELTWAGYTSDGTNLGETQDHTFSVSNCLAIAWQRKIDEGADLPDLYIINISIGAEGVTEKYMWYPGKTQVLKPGKLGTVNISLFSFSQHIFSMVDDSFRKMGKTYEYVGLHWRGGENDISNVAERPDNPLPQIYTTIIDGFNQTLNKPPIYLHYVVAKDRMADYPTNKKVEVMEEMNAMFDDFSKKYSNVEVFDVRNYPDYEANTKGNNMFQSDMIHFTRPVNQWVAKTILEDYMNGKA